MHRKFGAMKAVKRKPMKQESGATRIRRVWSEAEAHRLKEIVLSVGGRVPWSEIAMRLGTGRDANQCRYRWVNGCGKKDEWGHLDEFIVAGEHVMRGPRWAHMGRLLDRSENAVKNSWNAIFKSTTMYRPCSVLWLYIRELTEHAQPAEAFRAAVEAWIRVVPAVLAAAVIEEFTDWQLDNQPGHLAVQLPDPPVCPAGPSLANINPEHFKPNARYNPDAIASMKVSHSGAAPTSMVAPGEEPAQPYVQGHTLHTHPAAGASQLHHQGHTAVMPAQELVMGTAVDQISFAANPAGLGAAAIHNHGHIQVDVSAHVLAGAGMPLSRPLQAGQVVMVGDQAFRVVQALDTDSTEYMQLPAVEDQLVLPMIRAAPMPVQDHSMLGVQPQAFPMHAPMAADILRPPEPVPLLDLRDQAPFPVALMMAGAQPQSAPSKASTMTGQSGAPSVAPAFPTMREIPVPPPEPAGYRWTAPAEVPQAYVAAPPQHPTAGDRLVFYQSPAHPGTYFLS